ncbi:MAG: ATP-dependent helicase HrpB [Treponema sp.]|nr:ATP-dependent helicase HrpB [Treponema sp.]
MTSKDNPLLEKLPITPYLEEICSKLKASTSHFLVLTAATAAGKSTAVPVALLEAFSGNILMLEPRRLAAVAIAGRVAEILGEEPGETAGYRLHLESKIGPKTRLEVITEAILTRRLQSDPSLEGVQVIVLDEFHERSIHSDLALAFLKEAMLLRDDLYVIVMSATIQAARLSAYLDNAPVIEVPGRQFPVQIDYLADTSPAQAVLKSLQKEDSGSMLVFLPGISDIRRTQAELEAALGSRCESDGDVELLVLHSSIPLSEQRRVLAPQKKDSQRRRVILSSAIAETSITVPDVTMVIDSGLCRINRMNVALGMEKLVTERESLFSAAQRTGRAGRVSEGRCLRLWNQFDTRTMLEQTPPEILRTDLVPLVLECAAWGAVSPDKIDWLDAPSLAAWQSAQALLASLGCIGDGSGAVADGRITQKGKAVLELGVHPRLACTVIEGLLCGCLSQAVSCALRFSNYAQSSQRQQEAFCADLERRAERCVRRMDASWGNTYRRSLSALPTARMSDAELLLAGFPDRIGMCTDKASGEYQFPSGRKARISAGSAKVFPAYLVAPEVDAGSTTARIYSYEELDEAAALTWLGARAKTTTKTVFADDNTASGKSGRLIKTEYTAYGALVLSERRIQASAEDYTVAVFAAVGKNGIEWLPLNDDSKSLLVRARFYADNAKAPATVEKAQSLCEKLETLADRAEEWLGPFLSAGGKGTSPVSAQTVHAALQWYLEGDEIDRTVPVYITLANGKKRKLVYEDNGKCVQPVLEVIIQQIFGCFETPRVLGVPVLLKLLSPARRPLQITEDLAGFWNGSWLEICKEMKGRYPKHNWDYRVVVTEAD